MGTANHNPLRSRALTGLDNRSLFRHFCFSQGCILQDALRYNRPGCSTQPEIKEEAWITKEG